MEHADWVRIRTLFEEVLALPAEQRDAYLQQHAGNEAMIDVVHELLAKHNAKKVQQKNAVNKMSQLQPPHQERMTLDPGYTVGQYQIQEKIGAGGMGVIYQAKDTRLHRHVVLKFLPGHMHQDESARQRFMAEARAASRLDHPNICVIHDVGETNEGHMYISMPLYKGETLAVRISRGAITIVDAVDIAIQICDGLADAHRNSIIHRDVKPANIMLTQDGLVKILDFGVAKVADVNLTDTGMSVGTIAYMAPEQLNGDPADARTDIWAVGAIFYEMLTGTSAVAGKGLQQIIKSMFDEHFDPVAMLPDLVPVEIAQVIGRALQRDCSARYQVMTDMLDDLSKVRNGIKTEETSHIKEAPVKIKQENAGYEWDADFLDAMTDVLMPWLGPITPKMVKHYSKTSATLDSFIQCLEDLLPNDEARSLFGEKIKAKAKAIIHTKAPAPINVSGSNTGSNFELSELQLAALERVLLPELGPIAAILIRRVAASVTSWDALCDQLCQYFSSTVSARNFLKEAADIEISQ